jgi:hypothetical protein
MLDKEAHSTSSYVTALEARTPVIIVYKPRIETLQVTPSNPSTNQKAHRGKKTKT